MDQGRVSIEKAGRTYAGTWRMERGILTVSAPSGIKATQLDRSAQSPSGLARMMLRALVDEAERKASA